MLLKLFIKDYKNISNPKVRCKYGYLAGFAGIFFNIILFTIKIFIGLFLNSITIIADAFNNLSDIFTSIITILSFKVSSMPSSKKHPFGSGRIEYIGGLVVSFLIMLTGIQLFKSSFSRLLNPETVKFNLISVIIILMTIPVKLWLGKFNQHLGKTINSSIILANGTDALNDVLMSSSVVISLLLVKLFNINLDAYFGIGISLFIIYAGINIAKDVMIPLLGAKPSKEFIQAIKDIALQEEYVTNVHDVIVNNYGYGKDIISLHIEVPQDISSTEIYNSVTSIEQKISKQYNSLVIIQVDPTAINDTETIKIKMKILDICNRFDYIHKVQDLRIIKLTNTIIFDVVLEDDCMDVTKEKIENDINFLIKDYKVKINQISREGTYI